MLQKDKKKHSLKRSKRRKKLDGWLWLWMSPCVCLHSVIYFAVKVLNPTQGPVFFLPLFSLIDWTDWWSAVWSSQESKHWPLPWNPTTGDWAGGESVYTRGREMYTESHYSGPISCKCIHPPPLFVQQRYQCVCVFMAFCLHDSRVSQSINQTSYCTAAVQMVALGFLSIQFTADFHLQILHTPSPAARAPPAADMSRFQKRRKINHHRNVWSHDVRGAFKCWVIRSFLHTCSSSSEK